MPAAVALADYLRSAIPSLTTVVFASNVGSSYHELKEFGPQLIAALSALQVVFKLGPAVLREVIGEKAWLAAGFGDGAEPPETAGAQVEPSPVQPS